MKADAHRQWRLLDLQKLDTRLAQIAHRMANLPEAAAHEEALANAHAADAQLVRARTHASDVERERARAEADVQLVRDRASRNQARLEAGTGSSKDLQALQSELASLARRQSELEEIELEVMERAETAQSVVTASEQARSEKAAALRVAESARAAAVTTLEDEAQECRRTRADIAAGVGQDLLDLYEKILATTGMGAAELRERRCEGCRLELMRADLARFAKAPDDEILRCEDCRRILVRTGESGL